MLSIYNTFIQIQALQGHLLPCDDSTETLASNDMADRAEEVLI